MGKKRNSTKAKFIPPFERRRKDRPPTVFVACGETEVGKTYRTIQEFLEYKADLSHTGKKGRKVLALDSNDDDYSMFRTINPDLLRNFKRKEIRIIRPFNADGSAMNEEELQEVVAKIIKTFRDGLIVLDDINNFMNGAKGKALLSALISCRHKNIDLLFIYQSVAKISPSIFQNMMWLRLHKQSDDLTRIKDRVPNYYLVRIAQLIVNDNYKQAHKKFANGSISEPELKKYKSFFVYVNMRTQKIRGCTRLVFIRAAQKYINQEEGRKIKMMLNELDRNGKPVFKNRNEAIDSLIEEYLQCHEIVDNANQSPFQTNENSNLNQAA